MKTGVLLPEGALMLRKPQLIGTVVSYEESPFSRPPKTGVVYLDGAPILRNVKLGGMKAQVHWCPESIARILRFFIVLT